MSGAGFSPRGEGLVERRARVRPENVAWLRYVLGAHEGLAFMHVEAQGPMHERAKNGDGSGEVFLLAPAALSAQLDELVQDLLDEGCLSSLL